MARPGRWMVAAAFAWLPSGAIAQPVEIAKLTLGGVSSRVEWGQVVASPGDDWINDLIQLRSGNLLGVGFLNRDDSNMAADWLALAAEFRADGSVVSQRRYGDQGGTDAFWSALEMDDGRRFHAGFTTRIGPAGINAYVLVSRADGTIQKENGFGHGGYDRFTDLAPTDDGFVLIGHSQLPDEGALRRAYLVKTDGNGLHQWERIFGGGETWSALYIEPAGDGGFVIAGGTDGAGDPDMFVLKVDRDGQEQWRKRVGTSDWDEINHGLLVRPDGRIVLVGYTHPRGSEVNDLVTATLSATGEVERLERFGGSGDDRAILAKADSSGIVWVVGQSASTGAGGSDLLLTALDQDGAFTGSAATLGGPADDHGTAVLPLGKDAIIVAGYSRNLGPGRQDAFVARLTRPALTARHAAFKRTVVRQP